MTGAGSGRPMVSLRDVSYAYPGGVVALREVSLDVMPGQVLGVAGPNGAGKSTLARLLNGLLRPSSGHVVVDGLDTRQHDTAELAGHVGLVFQDPGQQLFARTVADELAFGPRNLGVGGDELRERVASVARRFELVPYLDHHPYSLPTPRRRLLAVASVVAMRPPILVLDEPTTGQDHRMAGTIRALVEGLRDEGVTIVCVSHDMPLLADIADRIAAMAAGRIVAEGTPREVFGNPGVLREAGLRGPQVARLSSALPDWRGPVAISVQELVAGLTTGQAAGPTDA